MGMGSVSLYAFLQFLPPPPAPPASPVNPPPQYDMLCYALVQLFLYLFMTFLCVNLNSSWMWCVGEKSVKGCKEYHGRAEKTNDACSSWGRWTWNIDWRQQM